MQSIGDSASYAPRSPDLSGATYAPRSPDLSGAGYAPRSPNLAGYDATGAEVPLQPLGIPPTSNPYLSVPPQIQTGFVPESPMHASAKRARKSINDDSPYESPVKSVGRGRRPKKPKVEEEEEAPELGKPAPGVLEGIEVKTKFPVAKIKRIMQHDDEVGKVAQVTPTAVSKALELFMISIVTKAAAVAREKQSKKVTVSHMKQVVNDVAEFDFLRGVTDKYTDTSNKKGRAKKESEESD